MRWWYAEVRMNPVHVDINAVRSETERCHKVLPLADFDTLPVV